MTAMKPGVLYGIGVGPGDPDLLTLAAVKALGAVRAVFAPASSKNDFSLALDIVRPYLRPEAEVIRLDFPMTRDDAVRQAARRANAQAVHARLARGEDAAFITLGDPLIYSTFGHLLRGLSRFENHVQVRIIPGITSFQAASARLRQVLVEGDQCLVLATGNTEPSKLEALLSAADAGVVLKPAKHLERLKALLTAMDLSAHAQLVVRCGLDGERVIADLGRAEEQMSYFSLVLVARERQNEGSENTKEAEKDAAAGAAAGNAHGGEGGI